MALKINVIFTELSHFFSLNSWFSEKQLVVLTCKMSFFQSVLHNLVINAQYMLTVFPVWQAKTITIHQERPPVFYISYNYTITSTPPKSCFFLVFFFNSFKILHFTIILLRMSGEMLEEQVIQTSCCFGFETVIVKKKTTYCPKHLQKLRLTIC